MSTLSEKNVYFLTEYRGDDILEKNEKWRYKIME